ncbi:1,4-alpha-glucan branching protein GlgB [Lacticigenium naphthae]|uniref:1,4-alpha-glucan branching protein GlgB n=1 Tax=Lacticigenium naphthae TaxID=515351 RepID=UPI00041E874C|nr:1,4-alpha-glucan branching protein GlgB [Lacticigenium naphthae]
MNNHFDERFKAIEKDAYLFNTGVSFESYYRYGVKEEIIEGEKGVQFTVWAPHARNIYVVGDFNQWQDNFELKKIGETGTWTGFSSEAKEGDCYKYRMVQADGTIKLKIDPFAHEFEVRPKDSSVIKFLPQKKWNDGIWLANRKRLTVYERPLNIYEVHMSSWKHHEDGSWYSITDLKNELIPYVKSMGYTHIEFLPLVEHPLDASWGYQATGYFAISSKFGTMEEFQEFVDTAHQENIGVIMDWVPGHFNKNDYGMAYFDGTSQFEYDNPIQAENVRWGTLNFDLSKPQIHSFLISNALFWIEQFHLDGLRVDAVSNMLYLDYDEGEWIPNDDGSNHNQFGVEFIQKMNKNIFERHEEILMIAEESTAWSKVTSPIHEGGLGFNYKWNMGWMNDTLKFFEMDPLFRKDHFNLITFSFMYTFNENFVLPFSHDEVVHGKKSMMHKMFGDRYNQFAGLRTIEAYRLMHPGKKLHFMGTEFGQFLEWRVHSGLEWENLNDPANRSHAHFMEQLNRLYKSERALWEIDHSPEGLHLLDASNAQESILIFMRKGKRPRDFVIVVCNFVPVERQNVRVGVPYAGKYTEILNTEMEEFGGTWSAGQEDFSSNPIGHQGMNHSIEVMAPAMSVTVIKPKRVYNVPKIY